MKKILIVAVALLALLIAGLFACSTDADNNSNDDKAAVTDEGVSDDFADENEELTELPASGEENALLVAAFTYLTAGQFTEAINSFSLAKTQIDSPNIFLEIGLGRAYFGNEDYTGAQEAFGAAVKIDPGRTDIQRYLGESELLAGSYGQSAETFRLLLQKEPDDKTLFGKLELSLRRNKDYEELFLLFEERLEALENDDENGADVDGGANESDAVDYYAGKLLETAVLLEDDDLIASVIDRFSENEEKSVMRLAYDAYQLLLSGEEDAAKELLFDLENIEALVSWSGSIYLGDYNDYGEYEGTGFSIKNGTVHFGEFKSGNPNGPGTEFFGQIYEWEDGGNAMLQRAGYFIESDWVLGIPDGDVVETIDWVTFSGSTRQNSGKVITTAFYSNGMAQGEVWREERQTYRGRNYVYYTKHVVEDGFPVPFEVTVNRRTVTVYEAQGTSKNSFRWTRENECNCIFIYDN